MNATQMRHAKKRIEEIANKAARSLAVTPDMRNELNRRLSLVRGRLGSMRSIGSDGTWKLRTPKVIEDALAGCSEHSSLLASAIAEFSPSEDYTKELQKEVGLCALINKRGENDVQLKIKAAMDKALDELILGDSGLDALKNFETVIAGLVGKGTDAK